MAITEVAALIVILVFIWTFFAGKHDDLDQFSGPKGLPLVGNSFQIDKNKPHITFENWGKKLADAFKITLFGRRMIVVNSYQSIYEVLVSKGQDFSGRSTDFRFSYISDNFSDICLAQPTPKWKFLRKTAQKHLKMYSSGMQRIEKISMELIGDMVTVFKGYNGREFDPRQVIYNTILNISALFTVGKKYSVDSEEFELFEKSEKLMFENVSSTGWGVELDLFPWLRFFGNSTFRNLQRFREFRDKLYKSLKQHVIENIREEREDKVEGVMFALYRLLKDQSEQDNISDTSITEVNVNTSSMDLIYAGTSTTASTLYCYLNIISQHPNIQRLLQDEADKVIGDTRSVLLSDREKMPYTRATVLETLRYSSVVPMGLPRSSIRPTTILGKPVPAGVVVLTNLYALHHDEEFWGDPYAFRPERFLDADGELLPPDSDERKRLLPFGAGQRVCLGEVLALSRLFLLVATKSQMFHVKPGSETITCDPREYDTRAIICQKDYNICLDIRNYELF